MPPKVSIVIPNWNGLMHLDTCFRSLVNQTYSNYEVILVDNGSTDGSVKFIREHFPAVKIIENKTNLGFAEGTNIGIRSSEGDYIATLNNDTKVDPMWLNELVKVAETNNKIGACASKVLFFYEPSFIDGTGILISFDGGVMSRGAKEQDNGQYDKNSDVFGASAGAALYKKQMLDEIGLFDEDFFAYHEDLDLSWRARLAGWECVYVHSAIVYHVHSATSVSYSPFKSFHSQRNRFFVIIKNFPIKMAILAILFTPIQYLLLLNSVRLKKGPAANFKKNNSLIKMISIVVNTWIDVIRYLPKMIIKRKNIQKNKCVSTKEIKRWFKDYKTRLNKMIYI